MPLLWANRWLLRYCARTTDGVAPVSGENQSSEASVVPPKLRRISWFSSIISLFLLLAGIAGFVRGLPWVLEGLGRVLVADEPLGEKRESLWIVLPGDHRRQPETYDAVAEIARSAGAQRVVIFSRVPTRVELLGIVPPASELAKSELEKRGLSSESIWIYPVSVFNFWDEARLLKKMVNEPKVSFVVCVGRFGSRAASLVRDWLFHEQARGAVRIRGIPDPRYHEKNWWKNRAGWKALFWNYLSLFQLWLFGEPEKFRPLSVDEYESWAIQLLFGQKVNDGMMNFGVEKIRSSSSIDP